MLIFNYKILIVINATTVTIIANNTDNIILPTFEPLLF